MYFLLICIHYIHYTFKCLGILPLLNNLPFHALIITCTIYLLNVQQSWKKRDVIIPNGHYGLIMPGGLCGH